MLRAGSVFLIIACAVGTLVGVVVGVELVRVVVHAGIVRVVVWIHAVAAVIIWGTAHSGLHAG